MKIGKNDAAAAAAAAASCKAIVAVGVWAPRRFGAS
jgi:hypothetical protein